jgi:group I intron endonuclease
MPNRFASGVYEVVHVPSGRRYIGSSRDVPKRLRQHRSALVANLHHSKYLQRVWNKYPADQFRFQLIVICDPSHLLMYEQLCIDHLNSELNAARSASAPVIAGQKLPKEWAEKVRATVVARYASGFKVVHPPRSEEYRQSVSVQSKARWEDEQLRKINTEAIRKAMTDEERAQRKERTRKLWEDPEYRAKAVAVRKGKAYNAGYKCTPEQVETRRRNARIMHTKRRFPDNWKEQYVLLYPENAGDVNA